MTIKVIDSPEEARRELSSVSSLVSKAQRVVAAGGTVNIADLHRHVTSLCEAIDNINVRFKESSNDMMPELLQLLSQLNRMEETLRSNSPPPEDGKSTTSGRL